MLKDLTIKTTRRVTSDDLRIFCDPLLTFEVRGYISPALNHEFAQWEEAGYSGERAAELISRVFVSVSQDGNIHPLKTKSDVLELRDAIEADNPGGGDEFLTVLLENFLSNHYRSFRKEQPDSVNLLTESSANGIKEPTP